jgi:2-polyprenyl-3-methyl-5-hydroxy-6-metoxy-1,4-benzoquinol methylase
MNKEPSAPCRFCGAPLAEVMADLGTSPLANSLIAPDRLQMMEPTYPLRVHVCTRCFLVQLQEFESPQHIFADYSYFSSYSDSWLRHCETYSEQMIAMLGLTAESKVVEVASNDGYLLQYFARAGIPILGIEPAANVAMVAKQKGIPTDVSFFSVATAARLANAGQYADLIVANNVLAHVPDINDFVKALRDLLKPQGIVTVEFPHLLNLIELSQFDTIYHEHFSYLSLSVVQRIFARHGLTLFDVEELGTHGGSLRIFARPGENTSRPESARVGALLARERQSGLEDLATYRNFQQRVIEIKLGLLEFLVDARRKGKRVAGYGAPAKGNTLLNYCGVGPELLEYTVDLSPHKQSHYLPGVRIPIYSPERIFETRPDFVLILPWNLRDEIAKQMRDIRKWNGQFVVPVPKLECF